MLNRVASLVVLCLVGTLVGLSATAKQGVFVPDPLLTLTAEEKEILSHMTIVHLDDGQGGTVKALRVSDINLQVVNGTGTTAGTANGLGNLIVGYNEPGNPNGDDRTGSHNLIAGLGNSFSSFGGLVASHTNTISAPFATVTGGRQNVADGPYSSVSGGLNALACGDHAAVTGGNYNEARGNSSSVSGGWGNIAYGNDCSISGGKLNTASGYSASVSGGLGNCAAADHASVSAGLDNMATTTFASVSGGRMNLASGYASAVSGGTGRSALDLDDWTAGTLTEDF